MFSTGRLSQQCGSTAAAARSPARQQAAAATAGRAPLARGRHNASESPPPDAPQAGRRPGPGCVRHTTERTATLPEKPSAQPARPDRALEDELRRTRDELRQTRAQLEIARAEVARLTAGTADAPPAGTADPKLQRAVQEQTEKLRALAATLALVEERERRALAQDLHDDLGQMIALIRLKASAMAALKLPAAHRKALAECTAAVDETHRRLRAMTFQLCPPMLHDMGLIPTLEWLADEIRHAYGLQVVVHDDGHPKPLDPSVTATLFRAVRELLINVARHAQVQAASVAVNLEKVNEGGEKLL
ncbi:MAG: hypothetical protein EP306_10275, partial [Burkholderiales bacterium]